MPQYPWNFGNLIMLINYSTKPISIVIAHITVMVAGGNNFEQSRSKHNSHSTPLFESNSSCRAVNVPSSPGIPPNSDGKNKPTMRRTLRQRRRSSTSSFDWCLVHSMYAGEI